MRGAPATGRTLTYAVTRVNRTAAGARVEHSLGLTTRCEAVDTDLPREGLVWHEVVAQPGQNLRHAAGELARLKVVQQRVVSALGIPDRLGLLALQPEDFFQIGPEQLVLIRLAGFLPGVLAQRSGTRELFDQCLRNLDLAFVFTLELANGGGGVAMRIGRQLRVRQIVQPLA